MIFRVELYTELLCYHRYLVSMLFADLLSLHLATFLMFFSLVYVTFYLAASQSSKSVLIGFLCRCMQYWLRPDLFKHQVNNDDKDSPSLHAHNRISNAILNNNCFVARWFVRMHAREVLHCINEGVNFTPKLEWRCCHMAHFKIMHVGVTVTQSFITHSL